MSRSRIIALVSTLAAACLLCFAAVTFAQLTIPGLTRTVLQTQDLSVPGHEGVFVKVDFAPGAREPDHTHPGDVFAYVMEGAVTLAQQGQAPVHLKAGDSFFIPAGRVHAAANDGSGNARLLVSFFVEKGKPITVPVK